jgi:hypothetical protein
MTLNTKLNSATERRSSPVTEIVVQGETLQTKPLWALLKFPGIDIEFSSAYSGVEPCKNLMTSMLHRPQ